MTLHRVFRWACFFGAVLALPVQGAEPAYSFGVLSQRSAVLTAENGMAVVRVTDNGGGIAEDVLPRIFDPYFTTKEKGTGIGLYMSKIIIENNMGGRIEARNLDGGAEFTVAVPLAA